MNSYKNLKFLDDEPLFVETPIEETSGTLSLAEINRKLDKILSILEATCPDKPFPPKHKREEEAPRGSMLAEIQSALASQEASKHSEPALGEVDSNCSLPLGVYDDNF